MAQLEIQRDQSSIPIYDLDLDRANAIYAGILPAATEKTLTVPTGATVAIVGASDHFFVGTDTVALPTGDFAAANGMQNVTQINVKDVTTLHFISRNACDVGVIFFTAD